MNKVFYKKLEQVFDLSTELANSTDETLFSKGSKETGSSLGQLLLDLVCQRERFLYLLKNKTTREWSCTVDDPQNKLQIMQALFHSSADLLVWIDQNIVAEKETQVLLELLQQESRYHGQLIQHVVNHKLVLPSSWSKHYS